MRLTRGAAVAALIAAVLCDAVLCNATLFDATWATAAAATMSPPAAAGDAELVAFAAHVNRTPQQSWPGYGVYLGNGLVLTASHVPGSFKQTNPHVVVGGRDFPAGLVKEGSLDSVDLTLLSFDPAKLPMRLRLRRMPLCAREAYPGEAVVVATPEGVARSRVLPPKAIPLQFRSRFGASAIPDVATTGNSGAGVFDAWKQCLLGVMSRKMTVGFRGPPPRNVDIAKYFVPVQEIRAFIPPGVAF